MGRVINTNPEGTATPEAEPSAPPPLTPKPEVPARLRGQPRGTSRWGGCLPWVLILAVLLGGFLTWKFPSFKAQAELLSLIHI